MATARAVPAVQFLPTPRCCSTWSCSTSSSRVATRRGGENTRRDTGTVDTEIEHLNPAGDGVAYDGRRQLIVPFTIPGERVRVTPGPPRGDTTFARLDVVLRPSPHRIAPYCPHFGPLSLRLRRDPADARGAEAAPNAEPDAGPCGGCAWQHIAYPEQLRLKTELVTRLVRDAVPDAPEARPML